MPRPLPSMDVFKKVALNVFRLRTSNGWSQSELARKLGVTKGAVHHWETLTSLPSIDMLVAVSNVFSVTMDALVKTEIVIEDAPAPVTSRSLCPVTVIER